MRTIAHLSDLHFGHLDPAILPVLRGTLLDVRPDLVVVSGDLTQRARREEFEHARQFLDGLPFPRLVVPGNHDVPLYDVVDRWLRPLGKYKAIISPDLEPVYADGEVVVVGVNTARALTFKSGRINRRQVVRCRERFASLGDTGPVTRIVVAHHPFILPDGANPNDLIGRARMGLLAFAAAGVDLILSGHLHVSRTLQGAITSDDAGPAALLVQAGTATSTRRRNEVNSFNVLRIDHPEVEIERWGWNDARSLFVASSAERYRRQSSTWTRPETRNVGEHA
ncbi:MAG TPA: metallophosphoesterase [Lichenihabitans sp.]|nr:metallophosphoesterase [Lichenihabitans sp.]